MKCPKCGFFGPDSLSTCKKCGKDLAAEKAKLGLTSFRVQVGRPREVIQEESSPSANIFEESPPPLPKVRTLPDEIKTIPPAPKPQVMPPPPKAPEKKKSVTQPPPPSPEDFSFDSVRSDYSLMSEKEESLPSVSPEETPALKSTKKERSVESLDDFEFPATLRTAPQKDVTSGEDDDFSTLAFSDGASEPFELPADEERTDSLPKTEFFPVEEPPKKRKGEDEEMLFGEVEPREEAKTALLTSKEIEDILKSEAPPLKAEEGETEKERGKTQLLDEDEISKLLESLDSDSLKSDNTP
ncbi:MAG: hypothetical protein V2A69_00790 [Pseudomonadota bacterium]